MQEAKLERNLRQVEAETTAESDAIHRAEAALGRTEEALSKADAVAKAEAEVARREAALESRRKNEFWIESMGSGRDWNRNE